MTKKERATYVKEVADIILQQLRGNIIELAAWGSKDFMYFDKDIDGVKMPTLSFKIRTPKVKTGGYVQISLDEYEDLYIVEALRIHGSKRNQIGLVKSVNFEDLHIRIRDLIEDEESLKIALF